MGKANREGTPVCYKLTSDSPPFFAPPPFFHHHCAPLLAFKTTLTSLSLLVRVVDLGREVVLDVADLLNWVLDNDGYVRGHGDDDGGAKVGGLGEEVQVAEGEG